MKTCATPLLAFSISLLLLAGCSNDSMTGKANRPIGSMSGKNVILISLDTSRADYFEPYGGRIAKTPAVQALADDGVLFLDAVTPTPLTVPAHATLLTGLHPIRHGVRDNFSGVLNDSALTLAELYREAGYETAGVIGAILLSRRNGFQQGFQNYDDAFAPSEFNAVQPTIERKADSVVDRSLNWLQTRRQPGAPFFLFMHFYDPHMLYQPPEPFRSDYKDKPYAGEIAYVDHALGRFFQALKTMDLYGDSIIVLVGDHGEGLGGHQEKTHGLFLYEETIRVPFIVKLPGGQGAGTRVSQTAALQDVPPTLSSLCALGVADHDGLDLSPWLFGENQTQERWTLHETQYPLTYNWSPLYALRSQEWKYIEAPDSELYHLSADANEANNQHSGDPKRAAALSGELNLQKEFMLERTPFAPVEQISAQQAETLAALGYTAGGSFSAENDAATLPDPKTKIEMHNRIDEGLGALARRNFPKAIQLFELAMNEDANNPTPYFNLGLAYMQMRRWDKAIECIEQALERNPGHVMIHLQLARAFIARGDLIKGRALLESIIDTRPQLADAHYQLGMLAFQEAKHEEALTHLEEAKRWMPDMPNLDSSIETVETAMRN